MSIILSSLVAAAALYALLTPHVHYAALGLVGVILGMAGLYFLQGAALVAVAQVVVYVGGVLVLLLFSLWLVRPSVVPRRSPSRQMLVPTLVLLGCVLGSSAYGVSHALPDAVPAPDLRMPPIVHLAYLLLGPYAWAFEWTGFVLLVALVGAVSLVMSDF